LSLFLERQGYRMVATPARLQRTTHSVHVENMYGSAIQQGTSSSPITINFDAKSAEFGTLVQNIKTKIPALGLDPVRTQELASDVTTIETQIASPAPKRSIITECLSSIRTILEGAAGSALATGILHEMSKYLP
jgi:hypothetical protein